MRFSRHYEMTEEFQKRQRGFGFAVVARAVLEIALETKKRLATMAKTLLKGIRMPKPAQRKPHQLVLELDSIAQIPLFRTA